MLAKMALAFLVSAASPQEHPSQNAEQLKSLVAALGNDTGPDDLDNLERRFGCSALPVLVNELKPVREKELYADAQAKHPAAMHLAFVVAALRYITGNEFTAPTPRRDLKYHSENAKYWLTLEAPPGEARIISYWPSHGTQYFGPIKTQRRVIELWRTFARSGECRPSNWAGREQGGFYLSGIKE
jgi:hypothetical protein